MVGSLIGTAAAAAAAAVALAGHGLNPTVQAGPTTAFGGTVPVAVAQVGHIEFDLEGSSRSALRQVRCGGGSVGARCFVPR